MSKKEIKPSMEKEKSNASTYLLVVLWTIATLGFLVWITNTYSV
jgi:hypothetical protein